MTTNIKQVTVSQYTKVSEDADTQVTLHVPSFVKQPVYIHVGDESPPPNTIARFAATSEKPFKKPAELGGHVWVKSASSDVGVIVVEGAGSGGGEKTRIAVSRATASGYTATTLSDDVWVPLNSNTIVQLPGEVKGFTSMGNCSVRLDEQGGTFNISLLLYMSKNGILSLSGTLSLGVWDSDSELWIPMLDLLADTSSIPANTLDFGSGGKLHNLSDTPLNFGDIIRPVYNRSSGTTTQLRTAVAHLSVVRVS